MGDREPDERVLVWARIEEELRAVVQGVDLSNEVRGWALEYLDHNELGLAFQTLVGALADTSADVSDAAMAQLGLAAREMGIEDDPDWRRLTTRSS